MSTYDSLDIDVVQFSKICHAIFKGKLQVPEEVDTITHIARLVTGIPELYLTEQQRNEMKMAMHSFAYNASPMSFMEALKRNKSC